MSLTSVRNPFLDELIESVTEILNEHELFSLHSNFRCDVLH